MGNGYRIRKELRDWLVFAPQNVIHDPPFTRLDLISCRNLLIYMQAELQQKLLTLFHYSLRAGGCLFLGTSETISEFRDLFQTLDKKSKVFRRKEAARQPGRHLNFPGLETTSAAGDDQDVEPHVSVRVPLRDSVVHMLASDFAPPTVVVSESGEIVHVHGRTGQFLELAPGGPPRNVIAMAREGLALDLSSALREAARQDNVVVHEKVAVKTNGESVLINLVVQKISEPESLRGLLRISFLTVAEVAPPIDQVKLAKAKKRHSTTSSREKQLERELQRSRESLQRTIEELDASNEEMKSTNEELQSTNEELQSTNEELETSKEELQSLNEELQTVNSELEDNIRDLSTANDDMSNLLNSTDIATLFLDNTLCIKRYTEQAKDIVRVIPTDVGRSLRDLKSRLQYDDLLLDAEQVLKTLIPKQCEVRTEDGHWRLMRIMPYRTSEDKIDGLVMTFVDIDESKRVRAAATALMEHIVATVREPLLVLDERLRVRFANRSFYNVFQVSPSNTVDRRIFELGNHQWNIPALRRLLEEILTHDNSFEDFEVTHDFPGIGRKRMLLNARRLPSGEPPSLILLAIEELNA